jgi:hypothetical protein
MIDDAIQALRDTARPLPGVHDDYLLLDDAIRILRAALPVWVPVSERPPDPYQTVFVSRASEGGEVGMAYLNRDDEWLEYGCGMLWTPTHWMPLPVAPKEAPK